MTDFQEISKDDNHVTVRFKQGKTRIRRNG